MKKEDFIIGQWYKNLGLDTLWIGRYAANSETTGFWGDMFITPTPKEYDNCPGYISGISKAELCSLEEIQQYLPDGHPDKIIPNNNNHVESLIKLIKNAV